MASSRPHRTLVRQTGVYTLASASQILSTLAVLPILTRWLSEADFGLVATGLIVMHASAILSGWGLPAAITKAYFRQNGREDARTLITVALVLAAGTTAALVLTGPTWSAMLFKDVRFEGTLHFGVFLGLSLVAVSSTQALLRAQGSAWKFLSVAVIHGVGGQLSGLGALVLQNDPTSGAYLTGMLVASGLAGLIGVAWTRPSLRLSRVHEVGKWGLKLGLPVIPHMAALQIINLGDRIIIERLLGIAAVGRYQVAYLVGSLGIYLISAGNNAWAPLIYGAAEGQRWHVLADTTRLITTVVSVMTVSLALAIPLGFVILAPPSYSAQDTLQAAVLIAVSSLPFVFYLANVHVLFHCGHTLALAWITPLSAILNIALNVVLISWVGLPGAALATLAAYSLQAWLVNRGSRRLATVPWRGRRMLVIVGGGVCGAAIAAGIPSSLPWVIARTSIAISLAVAVILRVAGTLGRRCGFEGCGQRSCAIHRTSRHRRG